MAKLDDIKVAAAVRGILPDETVTVENVKWFGNAAIELTYKDASGRLGSRLLYRGDEEALTVVETGRPWSFDGDGALFRLVAEAHRIRLAHLFDPLLAVHTSDIEPLPHQLTAVYDVMLTRQPLRFLLADDPGAGKTIMAGLLIKELIARGDVQRCLVVCPGSLAEQWQQELDEKFGLDFEILTNDKLESARTGNWFLEHNRIIARLDKLARNENVQAKLQAPECMWDLVICDEAHKLSASYSLFGNEVKYTKRYHLGELLSGLTRHFLLMTATPHNGKEADFQLFLALLDGDRFVGKFKDGQHQVDTSDLMRRMVKEQLLRFDGKPLFPERIAYTKPYRLSDAEAQLYADVTEYVSNEFNRAEKLNQDGRKRTVGFAMTVLQRRLASSPEAIYRSLERRRLRLESKLRELELLQRGATVRPFEATASLDDEEIEDLEDAPELEIEEEEKVLLDQATAASTLDELRKEIETLRRLEALALAVRRSETDTKWVELRNVLDDVFTADAFARQIGEGQRPPYGNESPKPTPSPNQKLVIFTEHRDTLAYLAEKVAKRFGRAEAVVTIHGGMGRDERRKVQASFLQDPEVFVLVATDAAGEGINLQRAHLMVNYDLPWNPNRLEQRFGRIHRIGQTEVCFLWNLVAEETREGDVYLALLKKLEAAREALGGQVFDVLGKVQFEGRTLRDLMIEAIRYGDRADVRAKLDQQVATAFDTESLKELVEERALSHEVMDPARVYEVRAEMERAEARRLQPHYIKSFFLEAFKRLGGTAQQREKGRYEITYVPSSVKNADRQMGHGDPVLPRYERIAFEKATMHGLPPNAFVAPGHPLLNAVIDVTLERNRDLLRRGAVLVDPTDMGEAPRLLLYLEHDVEDATLTRNGERRVISRQMLYVEMDEAGTTRTIRYAPYIDYRPLEEGEPTAADLVALPQFAWITSDVERRAQEFAIEHVVPEHLNEVRTRQLKHVEKTRAAVHQRLTREMIYWDHRAQELLLQELAGKTHFRLNSQQAQRTHDELAARMDKRMRQLDLEAQISPKPPVVIGGVLVVPQGLINRMTGKPIRVAASADTQAAAARARAIVMETERRLGFAPIDREFEKLGYDIESLDPASGITRFIEVKGRVAGADTITVTRNEILYSLNKPEQFILALVEFLPDESHRVRYLRQPFRSEPDFDVTSVNYDFDSLLARAGEPA